MSILLFVVPILIIIIVFHMIRIKIRSGNHHFICPECGEDFQVSFSRYFFTVHSLDGKCRITCPNCGTTSMILPLLGKE